MSNLPAELQFLNDVVNMSKPEIRGFIAEVESLAKAATGQQIEIPVAHNFSKGVYAREMKMKAGNLIIGKIHKHQNLNILSEGEATVISVDGVVKVKAPYTFVSAPGAKRVIYAHSDLTWTTIHGTHETDVDKIEEEFIAKSYEEVVELLGSSDAQVRAISENPDDQIPFPHEVSCYVEESQIEGMGLFASKDLSPDEVIAPARIDSDRTPAGRYANHAEIPNAKMEMQPDGNVFLIATTFIKQDEEITTDYYLNYTNTRSVSCHG